MPLFLARTVLSYLGTAQAQRPPSHLLVQWEAGSRQTRRVEKNIRSLAIRQRLETHLRVVCDAGCLRLVSFCCGLLATKAVLALPPFFGAEVPELDDFGREPRCLLLAYRSASLSGQWLRPSTRHI